jgi:hypothetical protein
MWRGFLHFAWSAARTHGVRRLFRGMAPTAARTPLFWAVYYSAYEASVAHSNGGGFAATGTNDVSTLHNSWVVLKAGSVAGGLGWAAVAPIDMIKTRIQSQPLGAPTVYKGTCLRHLDQ